MHSDDEAIGGNDMRVMWQIYKGMRPPPVEDTRNVLKSPMPGTLLSFAEGVREGAPVAEGQELCVVEAMKMQNSLRAPREGVVSRILVEAGSALATEEVILEFELEDDDDDTAKEATSAA